MTSASPTRLFDVVSLARVALITWAAPRTLIYMVTGLFALRFAAWIRDYPFAAYFSEFFWEPIAVVLRWIVRIIPASPFSVAVGFALLNGHPILRKLAYLGGTFLILFPYFFVIGRYVWERKRKARNESTEPTTLAAFYAERVARGRRRALRWGWISRAAAQQPPILGSEAVKREFGQLLQRGAI